ncbi:MAG: methionyl-tRNA formyltransferase [Candidatus Eremiobacteraeota bacterium]|nr:methionyl-tRNA formyltransferase [Candidatus Eremiobacteraeota bacterium]
MSPANGPRKLPLRNVGRPRGVFFGTSTFAERPLRAFAATVDCVLVVTQPDRPAGRGQRAQATPVKQTAYTLGIPTLEPEKMSDALATLRTCDADLFAVASYGKILPRSILELPRLGALNLHPSLLPLYRGAIPLQSQLRDGVRDSGVTIIMMDAGMDTGDIVLQERHPIGPREDYGHLHDRFAVIGAQALVRACELALSGRLQRTPQHGLADEDAIARTLTRPLRKGETLISTDVPPGRRTARDLVDHIRAFAPDPGARIMLYPFHPAYTKILAAHALQDGPKVAIESGNAVMVKGWILIRASDGWVAVDRLGVPGRRPTTADAFRHGYPVTGPKPYDGALLDWYEDVGETILCSAPSSGAPLRRTGETPERVTAHAHEASRS